MKDPHPMSMPAPAATPAALQQRQPCLHRAYGLRLRSDLPWSGVSRAGPGDADLPEIRVRLGCVALAREEQVRDPVFRFSPGEHLLAWQAVGRFLVRAGEEIVVEPGAGCDPALLQLPLQGPVTASLLHQRGALVLHASAVEGPRGAWIFVGDKGAGKSTTAAAFLQAGHALVADDIVSLSAAAGENPLLYAGFPGMKLDPAAALALFPSLAGSLDAIAPGLEKRRLPAGGDVSRVPLPPAGIFVLERGDAAGLDRLAPAEALVAAMRYSYMARFGSSVLQGEAAGRHLAQCSALAAACPAFRLRVPAGLNRVHEAVSLLERGLPA